MTNRNRGCFVVSLIALLAAPVLLATPSDVADHSIRQFLARQAEAHAYRAERRLEAENGDRKGWIEAITEYSPDTGLRYEITAEGGSSHVRTKVLRPVLDNERDVVAQGAMARSALARSNYTFEPVGVDTEGLATILLSPRRKEHVLVSGKMFLRPEDGGLVRVQGRLAKSPSFWIKNVDIVRTYERIAGVVVPVALESRAHVRFLGTGTLRMTYTYLEIDGQPVTSARRPLPPPSDVVG
jgi:hypothetical protein